MGENIHKGYLLFLILLSFSSLQINCHGFSHSPHRPRSPHVAVHTSGTPGKGVDHPHHHHYVPQRPVPGSQGTPAEERPILTHDTKLLHDKEHLKEDLGDWVFADGKELTPEEMEFHYFKMHDFDNNSMLDGLEILQAISHILPVTEVDGEEEKVAVDSPSSVDIKPSLSVEGEDAAKMSLSSSSGRITQENQKMRLEAAMKRAELIKQREEDFDYYTDLIDKVLQEDDLNQDGFLSYFEYAAGRRRDEKLEKAKAHQAAMHSNTLTSY